jgi:predicted negative regulator of RcsB-dependent stress response
MLKPKKKITQKEIQRDPFLESVDSAQAHLEHNKKLYSKIGVGILAIVVGFTVLNNKNKEHTSKGVTSLSKALVALDQEDLTNAKFQLETVVNDYSGTNPAIESGFFLGKIYFDEGDFNQASSHLNNFISLGKNKMLLAASARMLADIEVQNGNIDEAIRIIRIAIKKTSLANQKNSLILDEAALLISNGNVDDARQKIQMVLEVENLPSSQKQDADLLLGKLTS